jgi:hypothetical protein
MFQQVPAATERPEQLEVEQAAQIGSRDGVVSGAWVPGTLMQASASRLEV